MGSQCRSCGADVIFTESVGSATEREASRRVVAILDATPREDGNIVLDAQGRAVYLTGKDRDAQAAGRPRYVSHYATCPEAKAWRKRKDARS